MKVTAMFTEDLTATIQLNVTAALNEDIREGDLTAELIPEDQTATAHIISRQQAILCGSSWFEACFLRTDPSCTISWSANDGELVKPNQVLCEIKGSTRALLTAERSALNFLQSLSGTATLARSYVDAVAGINIKIMDTRKTLPGLRMAQKYAVKIGGGHNQRSGLFDGVLIKENHVSAAGGISEVMAHAHRTVPSGVPIQIEVETLVQLDEALEADAKLILLDNFSMMNLRSAVTRTAKRAELEASGNITLEKVRLVAETGVDRISIGALTKDVQAVDLSMRLE